MNADTKLIYIFFISSFIDALIFLLRNFGGNYRQVTQSIHATRQKQESTDPSEVHTQGTAYRARLREIERQYERDLENLETVCILVNIFFVAN